MAATERAERDAEQALAAGASAAATTLGAWPPLSPSRVARVLGLAERGRGRGGWWARMVTGLGWDLPGSPRAEGRLMAGAAALVGFGVGLAVLGGGAGMGWWAGAIVATGVAAAVRAVWTPRQPRGPPLWRRLWNSAQTLARPWLGGLLGAGVALGWSSPTWVGWVHSAWAAMGALPHYAATTAALSAVAVSASLAYRDVLHRQLANQLKNLQLRPRLAASRSAVLVALVSAGWKIAAALDSHAHTSAGTFGWVFGTISGGVFVVAVLSALVQSKEIGRARGIKAVLAGATALGTAGLSLWLIGSGHGSVEVSTWVSALLLSGTMVSGNTPIADYLTATLAKGGARIVKKRLEAVRAAEPAATDSATRLRRLQAWLDFQSTSPVDPRLIVRKVIGSIISALGSYAILHPWSGADSPGEIALRTGLVVLFVWATGKIRDWDAYRAPDQPRANYYGDQSSRPLRASWRPSWWRGDRLGQRATDYRHELDALLARFGLLGLHNPDRPLDRVLAERLATRLFTVIAEPIEGRADEWTPIPGADTVNRALHRERQEQRERQDQHRVASVQALMVLGQDPAALARVAARLRARGRAGDAEVAELIEFQLMLGEQLVHQALANPIWRNGTLPNGKPDETRLLPDGASRSDDWDAQVDTVLNERTKRRPDYLSGPLQRLLEAITTHYDRLGQPQRPLALAARRELGELYGELQGEELRRIPTDPLSRIEQLHQQRRSSASEAARAEQHALDHGAGNQARLGRHQRLGAAHGLLGVAAGLLNEAGRTQSERRQTRRRWTEATDAATGTNPVTTPSARPTSLLDVLLVAAGEPDGWVSAERLTASFGGAVASWRSTLADLATAGALTADNRGGYRAHPDLVAAWREASPRLRAALRADPTGLPGGHLLAPLTHAGPRGPPEQLTQAYQALRRLLRAADEAWRRPRDTVLDDAGRTTRRLIGLGYRARHPSGRVSWPTDGQNPLLEKASRAGAAMGRHARTAHQRGRIAAYHRRRLRARIAAAAAATRALHRLLLAVPALRAAGLGQEAITALLNTAHTDQSDAYTRLAQVRDEARTALTAVRAYPHQTERTLRAAERALATAPGADLTPDTAAQWLRELTAELHAARRALRRGLTGAHLERARTLLERYELDRAYAWQRKLWRTWTGWQVMERARYGAEKLEAEFPATRTHNRAPTAREDIPTVTDTVIPIPATPGTPTQPGTPGRPDATRGGPAGAPAATTLRGPGNHTNADAASTAALPDGSTAVMVADGVSSTPDADQAANAAMTAARDELTRTDQPGRSHARAIRDAYRAAADALTAHYTNSTPHPRPDASDPATTVLIAIARPDGRITVGWVGDSRAYYLADTAPDAPPGTPPTTSRLLTADHTRAGLMTRWLSARRRPDIQLRTIQAPGPGLLLATTDGLHQYLPSPNQMHTVLNAQPGDLLDPTTATQLLPLAARAAGSNDDATAAATRLTSGQPTTANRRQGATTPPVVSSAGAQPAKSGTSANVATSPQQHATTRGSANSSGAGGVVAGGAVADHVLDHTEITTVLTWWSRPETVMVRERESGLVLPRAPPDGSATPVPVLITEQPFPVPGVIAFGRATRRAVVISRATAETLAAWYVADPAAATAWWIRLIGHERAFHLPGGIHYPQHTGEAHDQHAAPIAAAWATQTHPNPSSPGLTANQEPATTQTARRTPGLEGSRGSRQAQLPLGSALGLAGEWVQALPESLPGSDATTELSGRQLDEPADQLETRMW